ncbi:MAG: ABC transporter permease [Chloroflexota bacterium]
MATTTLERPGQHSTTPVSVISRLFQIRIAAPLIALGVLSILVVVPLLVMAIASVRPANSRPIGFDAFVLSNFVDVFGHPSTLTMLRNTVVYAVGAMIIGVPIAFTIAFLTERTDMPFRTSMYTLMFIPLSIPPFATALGWVLLLGPRAGTLNQWVRMIFGLDIREGPVNIFSMEGMIFVHALGIVPSMWLLLISVLRNMDPTLEEAAAATGASRWKTIRHVTGPLMTPGLLSIIVLFTVVGLESLETPLALGKTAGIDVLSTRVYDLLNPSTGQGVSYGQPAALGMFGLVIGIIGIAFYMRLVRAASKYTVITGKAYRPRVIQLGRWRWAALGFVMLFMLIKVVIPFAILLATSFQRFYQPLVPGVNIAWTLSNYESMLDWRFFGQYALNSFIVAIAASSVTMLLVSFFAWQLVRWPSPLTRLVNVLAFMPLAIPGVISGLAFFLLFIGTPLYGTLILVSLAFTANYIAYGTRLMHAAQVQIHRELEEAALTGGVSHLRSFFYINLRLLLPAFMNGWLWIFVNSSRNFTIPLMVASASAQTVANIIFGRYSGGNFPIAAAMMIALVTVNMLAVFMGRKWITRAIGEH